jgi:hypothetical protein
MTALLIHIFIHSSVFIPQVGSAGTRAQSGDGMALAHCILGKFLGVGCHYFPLPLGIPTFVARCLHVHNDVRDPSSKSWNCGREMSGDFAKMMTSTPFRDLFHATNLRHGTNGFISPPKEGVLRIFSPLKIQWLRLGLNP